MEDIARLQASRRGHKSHLSKVLNKASEILKVEPSKADEIALTTLKTTLEQLTRKQQLVRELDERIAEKITDEKQLEAEIYESEELSCDLEEKLNHIRKYIELCSLSSQSNQFTQGTSTQLLETQATTQEIQELPSQVINSSNVLNEPGDPPPTQQNLPTDNILSVPPSPQPSTASIPPQNICRLPKLSLPVFAGNPLQWQSFWDSFDAAVHNNPSLNGIQRFNYLIAQLV